MARFPHERARAGLEVRTLDGSGPLEQRVPPRIRGDELGHGIARRDVPADRARLIQDKTIDDEADALPRD